MDAVVFPLKIELRRQNKNKQMIANETQISALVTDWSKIGAEQTSPGITRQMVVGQNVMMVRFTFEPFLVTPEHTHPHEQMTIVAKGRVRFFTFRPTSFTALR
jgi:quercetin dioxygenase-like cupin family protein